MAQELEQIVAMLREMNRANNNNSESFDRLLASINSKLEMIDKNAATAALIIAYLTELAKTTEDKYSTTVEKLGDIEKALKAILNDQDKHVKDKEFKKSLDALTKNLKTFNSEAKKQKTLISKLETRLAEISSDKTDKEDILRTATLLINDFQNLSNDYKNSIGNINSDLKSILTNLVKSDQVTISAQGEAQVEILREAVGDIVTYLTAIDKRDASLEQLLSTVATNENLKLTQGVIDSIIQKSEEISAKITSLADRTDIEELQSTSNNIVKKAEALTNSTDEIKQTLAKVTKDIDALPSTTNLEESLQSLFKKLSGLSKDVDNADSGSLSNVESKIKELAEELSTIKNIVGDLNEVVTLKVLTAINDLSFEEEFHQIKDQVSKMLTILPQKEDIDKLLDISESSKLAVEELAKKADDLIQTMATKEDVESLSTKADEIENMIDDLNFDEEFDNLYDKTASIEKWLVSSHVKENTEEIIEKMDSKAEQKDILTILKTVENIVNEIDELSKNVDAKKIDRTVAEVYQMIEELKNDFLNTTEMHNDSIVVNLSELQKSIENIVTGDEFDNFVEDLKAFVVSSVSDSEENKTKFVEIKEYQENILNKLAEINTSSIEEAINKSALNIEEKLDSISDYLTNVNKTNAEEIKKEIAEIKEILENKKSNIKEVERENLETIKTIENYLKEIKVILDTSDKDLSEEVRAKLEDIEISLKNYQTSNETSITAIISKLDEYQSKLDIDETQAVDLTPSLAEISEIKEQIVALAQSFNSLDLDNPEQASSSAFVSEILNELGANLEELSSNIDDKLQHGFIYNAELIEEKTATIIDFIKELKESSEQGSKLYDQLDEADNKLDDYKQELEFINTDVISSLGAQTEQLLLELEPIKEMLATLVANPSSAKEAVKEDLTDIHDSVIEDLAECTKYSKSTYDKLEDSYEKISRELTDTQNNLKDFILGDIDSVIIKIDSLREDLEDSLNRISPPEAEYMAEFKKFVEQIAEFKGNPTVLVAEAKKEIAEAVTESLIQQHEELKSMLAVSLNNDEIIAAIEELKACFWARLEDLSELKHAYQEEPEQEEILDELEDFASNQYEKAFEVDKNAEIISELRGDFDKFSELIKDLTEENAEISEVLDAIKSKMETITVASVTDDMPEVSNSEETEPTDGETNKAFASINTDEMKKIIESKVKEVIVGAGNFDFIKAFDLMKQDILALQDKVTQILSKEQQKEASTTLASIPTVPFEGSSSKILAALDEKFELLTKTINPKEWLGEIKTYIAGDQIHTLLEEISGKIDILTLADNSDMVNEIKEAIAQLKENNDNTVTTDPQIQSMLTLINEKVDILASNDDYELIEDVRDAIERLDDNINNSNILNTISSKLDVIASTDNMDDFEEIKESLNAIEDQFDSIGSQFEEVKEQIDSVKQLSEADTKITSMLENLNDKIDSLSDNDISQQGIEDVKALIMAQTDFIENLEKNGKTDAVKKCLEKLTLEVNSLVTSDNTKQIQKTIKEMKESVVAAIVTVFEQVSFIEESEDIKDFVEEKTDEINQNLASVTTQLKQIASSEDDSDYVYSMQDIESDLAKLRLALSNLQENEEENQAQRLSSILENINTIGASVEELQNSITKDDELKDKFERVTTDIGKLISDNLTTKVDNVTKLLETSHASDKVMRQALIYMGEWIDTASESMNKISTNSEEIVDIKSAIDTLKKSVPEQTEILNSIEEKFDEQQERLAFFEKQIAKLGGLEDKFEAQQERIDRLEMSLDKILTAVEDIDDSKVTRKIDKIDKQLAKLSTNIEKLASYVD